MPRLALFTLICAIAISSANAITAQPADKLSGQFMDYPSFLGSGDLYGYWVDIKEFKQTEDSVWLSMRLRHLFHDDEKPRNREGFVWRWVKLTGYPQWRDKRYSSYSTSLLYPHSDSNPGYFFKYYTGDVIVTVKLSIQMHPEKKVKMVRLENAFKTRRRGGKNSDWFELTPRNHPRNFKCHVKRGFYKTIEQFIYSYRDTHYYYYWEPRTFLEGQRLSPIEELQARALGRY